MNRSIRRRSNGHSARLLAPAIVRLEERQMLSGNVTVGFDGADLVITGDKSSNDVQVLYDGVDVIVRGLNGTTINGGGGDFLAVAASDTLPGGLRVDLLKGNDLVYISGGVQVTDDVFVQPGVGHDKTVIRDAGVGGDIFVGSPFGLGDDPGNDSVSIDSTTAATVSVATGGGHDLVELTNVVASEDVIVLLGAGNDAVFGEFTASENVIVAAGAGNDLFFAQVQAGGFAIDMEAGNDALLLIEVDQTDAARQATINMGTGNDVATVGLSSASFVSLLSISGSTGTDKFFLLPGAVTNGGLTYQEVESMAPYFVFEDAKVMKTFTATLKRAEAFDLFVSTLP